MNNKLFSAICMLSISACLLTIFGCNLNPTKLEMIKQRGELRVVTRVGPTTYYFDRDGETGLEYQMAQRFAEKLGVKLKIITAQNTADIISALKQDKADIAAAALSPPLIDNEKLMFGPSYQWITPQVVYRHGRSRPQTLEDISPDQLHITDGTLLQKRLDELREHYPYLSWYVHKDKSNTDLLQMIEDGKIAYTVVYSNEVQQARHSNPEIRAAFNLSEPHPLSWAVKWSDDTSVLKAIEKFHREIAEDGTRAELINYFYGPTEYFDYVESRKFVDRVSTRLPKYIELFKKTAEEFGFDWRFLAAVSYQESHWNERAHSPTGVKGLMMLTLTTAKQLNIKNRLDPAQSVRGGAMYLQQMIEKIPDRIPYPDRRWLGLAAYNVGYGHLEDARVLTEAQNKNPDKWQDVRESLPLLSRKAWYKKTRYGYARGHEPVRFVESVRKYYRILVQLTQPDTEQNELIIEPVIINSPVL